MQNKLLNVFYNNRKVGRLAETPDKLMAFEYDMDWLNSGFSISPFKLPLEKRVFIADWEPFYGNFGVFNDSLPDGWGRMLIDRMLRKMGMNPAAVSTLDRLAIVGSGGMGALEYKPEEMIAFDTTISDLNTLAKEAHSLLNDDYNGKQLNELIKLGGSSGGARPKVLLNIDGDDWIIKFRASEDPKNIGKLEFKYMQTAKAAGLTVPEIRLFEGKYFGAKRFDRNSTMGKVFMTSASALLNTSHRLPTMDYNSLMGLTLELTRDYREVQKMFRLMCFNIYSHNRDDHSKNFSFLYDDCRWQLSPAYDLVYSYGMGGEHATTIDGEGRNPTEKHILSVAKKANIDREIADSIIFEVKTAIKKAKL